MLEIKINTPPPGRPLPSLICFPLALPPADTGLPCVCCCGCCVSPHVSTESTPRSRIFVSFTQTGPGTQETHNKVCCLLKSIHVVYHLHVSPSVLTVSSNSQAVKVSRGPIWFSISAASMPLPAGSNHSRECRPVNRPIPSPLPRNTRLCFVLFFCFFQFTKVAPCHPFVKCLFHPTI